MKLSKIKDIKFYYKLLNGLYNPSGELLDIVDINRLYLNFISLKKLLFLDKSKELKNKLKILLGNSLATVSYLFINIKRDGIYSILKKDEYNAVTLQNYIFDIYINH